MAENEKPNKNEEPPKKESLLARMWRKFKGWVMTAGG